MDQTNYAWLDALPEAVKAYTGGRNIEEVECIVPDLAGMSRGKAMPANQVAAKYTNHNLRMICGYYAAYSPHSAFKGALDEAVAAQAQVN
jgi:glutamine synthetase